jgi:hypothetical protein
VKPISRFNIYDSMIPDEMHQLTGVYSHLLGCVEKIDIDGKSTGVNIKNK